ncbi:unnamed protein product [Urochloa humidicola]
MGDPSSTIPALPARPPHATSSPASSLAPMPVTVFAAAAGAVPVVIGGADPAPAAVVGVAPAPAPVVGAGADAVHIVFAAATAAATRRDAIREEARRKKAQTKQGGHLLSAAEATKRKASGVKHPKAPATKRLKSPMVSVSPLGPARSPGIRMMLSPRTVTPSTELLTSSQESPISPFINKRRNLHRGSFIINSEVECKDEFVRGCSS